MKGIRERAMEYGVQSLFDVEALSLLLGIKQDLLSEVLTIKQFKERYPMMKLTAIQKQKVEALFEVMKRLGQEEVDAKIRANSPQAVYRLVKWEMASLKKEEFRVVLLDTKCKVIGIRKISEGSLTASIVHPREVFKEAILESAYSFIVVHNHPSGETTPSKEDIAITKRLQEVGQVMGIQLLDHVIVSSEGYTSLKDGGYL